MIQCTTVTSEISGKRWYSLNTACIQKFFLSNVFIQLHYHMYPFTDE